MARKFVLKNEETGEYLQGLEIYNKIKYSETSVTWTRIQKNAYHFENLEEANATIDFIGSVIDWELGEQLIITPAEWIPEKF